MRLFSPAGILLLLLTSDPLIAADESDAELGRKIVIAAVRGDLREIQSLHAQGLEVDATNDYGLTAYQAAKIRGHQEVARWLAENGADTERVFPSQSVIVDSIIAEQAKADLPGVAVLVSRDGEVLFSKGYGLAKVDEELAITTKTKFRIGSVTKQFAAAAILRLQEERKLSVTDTLDKYIPDYPRGNEVTLHHLLTHTSGIKSYTSKPQFYGDVTQPIEPAALIDSFKQDEFDFDPGQKWSYCNSGYFLLGYIVAEVSGMSFGEYLQETFFDPLEMKATGLHRPELDLTDEAQGYSYGDDKFNLALNWHMSRAGAAGAIYSTVEDLNRWNDGIFGGKVLTPESLEAAFTKVKTKEGENSYGYGWFMNRQRGLRTIGHGGGLQGFLSYLVRYPEQNLTIAILHNSFPTPGNLEPSSLAGLIAETYLWEEMKPIPVSAVATDVDPRTYNELAGRYDYGAAVLIVTVEDNRLFAQLTGQPKFEIFPKSASKFFWKVVEAEVEILRDNEKKVVAVQHTQGGQSFRATKIKEKTIVKLNDKVLDRYLGTYDFGELSKMVVTRKEDHLAAKLATQPALDVFPKSETEFFYQVIQAELEFVLTDSGDVEKVILRQGPVTLQGKRTD